MKKSLIIHLIDLFGGRQFNGRVELTGGIGRGGNCPGRIVWRAIGIGGNCPEGDCMGAIGMGGNCPGEIVPGAISWG